MRAVASGANPAAAGETRSDASLHARPCKAGQGAISCTHFSPLERQHFGEDDIGHLAAVGVLVADEKNPFRSLGLHHLSEVIFGTSARIVSTPFSLSSPFLKAWLASTFFLLYMTTVTSASLDNL